MNIQEIKLSELKPYDRNPRHNEKAIDLVANSIKEFGFKQPIVIDENNVIVCGHTRYEASKKLGLKQVPCVVADDLSEEQIKAYRLADNKVAEASEWDNELLNIELDDIFELDMEQFGFMLDDEVEKEEKKPEVDFSEVFNEENNYLILQFKTDIDWLQAQSVFNIEPKMAYSTRKDGKVGKSMRRIGTGRVLDGAEALKQLLGDKL